MCQICCIFLSNLFIVVFPTTFKHFDSFCSKIMMPQVFIQKKNIDDDSYAFGWIRRQKKHVRKAVHVETHFNFVNLSFKMEKKYLNLRTHARNSIKSYKFNFYFHRNDFIAGIFLKFSKEITHTIIFYLFKFIIFSR